jgi:hypothetical protein
VPYTSMFGSSESSGGYKSILPTQPSAAGLEALLAQTDEDEGNSIMGMLGNLVGGGVDIVGGLGKWFLNDNIAAWKEALTLGKSETDFMTDDIVKGMAGIDQPGHPGFHPTQSVLAQDIAQRYGPLSPFDDRPASDTLQELYDDPASFLLDAASIASLGGTAAAGAATKSLGTGGRMAAKEAALQVAQDIPTASARQASRIGTRTAIEGLGDAASPLQQLLAKTLPQKTYRVAQQGTSDVGSTMFLPVATSANPLYRGLGSGVRRLTTSPIDEFAEEVKGLRSGFDEAIAKGQTPIGEFSQGNVELYEDMLKGAKDRGLTRIENAFGREQYAKWTSRNSEAATNAAALKYREEVLRPAQEALKVGLDVGDESMATLHRTATALDVGYEGITDDAWYTRQFGDIDQKMVALADAPEDVMRTMDETAWTDAKAADPIVAEKTEELIGRLEAVKATYLDDAEGMDDLMPEGFDAERQLGAVDRIIRGLEDGLTEHTQHMRSGDVLDGAGQSQVLLRLLDVEQRLPMMEKLITSPVQYLERLHAAARAKIGSLDNTKVSAGVDGEVVGRATESYVEDVAALQRQLDAELAITNPVELDTHVLQIRELEQRIARAQAGETVERTVALGDTRITERTIDGLDGPPVELLDDALRRNGIAQPIYYPYVDAERQAFGDFFASKKKTGANIAARDPHEKKLWGTLLKEGTYETDPLKAWNRRAARAAREVNTMQGFMHRIQLQGRRINHEAGRENVPDGFVVVAPDALMVPHRIHLRMQNFVEDQRMAGYTAEEAAAQAFQKFGTEAMEAMDTLLKNNKPAMYAIPESLAKEMDAAAKWSKVAGTKGIRSTWDPVMNAWRGLVLTGSPRWLLNNMLGNTIFGVMQGVKVRDVMKTLTERYRAMVAQWADKHWEIGALFGGTGLREKSLAYKIEQLAEEGGVEIGSGFFDSLSETYTPKLGDAATTRTGRMIERGQNLKRQHTPLKTWSGFMRHVNGEIEHAFREASFLRGVEHAQGARSAIKSTARSFYSSSKRIEKIMADGYTEASAQAAMREVNKFFGDYTALGPFERHVVRRFVMPFYAFYKHTAQLIVRFPLEYPVRAEVLRGISMVTEDMMAQYGPLPEWLEKTGIPVGPVGPDAVFMTSGGANPFSGLTNSPLGALSPPIKVALEQALGRDLFTGEGFTDEDTVTPFGSDQAYDETGQPVADPRPSWIESLLQSVPQYDMAKQAIAGGATYDTATLLDVLGGHGVIRNDDGSPQFPTGWVEQLKKIGGIGEMNFDVEGYQEGMQEEQLQALMEILQRQMAQEAAS